MWYLTVRHCASALYAMFKCMCHQSRVPSEQIQLVYGTEDTHRLRCFGRQFRYLQK